MKSFVLAVCLVGGVLSRDLYQTKQKPRINSEKSSAGDQYLDCYDYSNNGGDRLRAIDYIDSLTGYNFNDRITSCCFTGIWLLYSDENYNSNNIGASNWWQFGDNYCTNVPSGFDNMASSLRYTGAPDAWTADTLNLYLNEFFQGGEEYTYADIPQMNYNDQARSIIVTGRSAWTLYEGSNYNGNCKCVWPSDTNNGYPGFYSTENSLGFLSRTISSARRGCFCGSSKLPENHPTKTTKAATSGFHKGN